MRLKILYIFFFLTFGFSSQAQNYPVQTFIQVSPPFTSYLPDYSNPANEQMKIFLTLTDMTVPSYDVKLRFKFQGSGYTIENPTYLNLPPITITPGTPYELSGAALAIYLSSQNLVFTGINTTDYENRKVLPEGPCLICVEVYDYNSPTPSLLGNPSCSNVWFSMYDPPYLNTPICSYEAPVSDPQQILFNWTPLNMVSPTGVNATEYVFELFEIRPEGANPNVVVNSTLPIFMQVTNQSFVNYSITEPQLQVGMEYVWRVQVRDNSGRDYFKNQGYSQVCTFTYGSIAGSLLEGVALTLNSEGTGVRQGTAWWDGSGIFDSYILETRKTGNNNYEWFPLGVMGLNTKINSLEPETEYECRVKGIVGAEESEWSNASVFTTQPPPNYSCGTTTMPATQPNVVPYVNATEGMVFTVGQFDMMVTSITPLTEPGHYVGTGKISIPFALINLNVSFEDILVDENLAVREGKVEAISKGMDAWIGDLLNDQCLKNSYNFPGVDSITFTDSTALVQFGEETLFIDSLPAAVITPDGYTYYIYEDGTYSVEFNGTISEDNLGASDSLKIVFEKSVFQEYGFDVFSNGLWVDSYETIVLDDGSNYIVPYKSILSGGEDHLIAKVVAPTNFVLDSISFRCLDGRILDHIKLNDTIYEVELDQFSAEEEAVYAYWRGDKMGKLNVRAYDSIAKNVVIVPVNGASINNQGELGNIVNNIYKQALVTWNLTIDSNFTHTAMGATLENADVNLMTHYSSEMRALRDAYLDAHPDFDKSTYILFVVDEFDEGNVQGYMVRGKGVGFLSANPLGKTIAHELGHGAFGLYHTFPTPAQGSTFNLLDYVEQTHLTKYQWEKIHNWSPTLSFLDDEEDAESILETQILLEFIKANYGKNNVYIERQDFTSFALGPDIPRLVTLDNGETMLASFKFHQNYGNLNLTKTNGIYNGIFIQFSLEFESEVNPIYKIKFKNGSNTILTIYSYYYRDFELLMGYLHLSITESMINKIVGDVETALLNKSDNYDCEEVSLIIAALPDFILASIESVSWWSLFADVAGCTNLWSGEKHSRMVKILSLIDSKQVYDVINNSNKTKLLFRKILRDAPTEQLLEYIYVLSKAGNEYWTNEQVASAKMAYAYPWNNEGLDNYGRVITYYNVSLFDDAKLDDLSSTSFRLGAGYNVQEYGEIFLTGNTVLSDSYFNFYDPVNLIFGDNEMKIYAPGFIAHEYIRRFGNRSTPFQELLQFHTQFLLPELTLAKMAKLPNVFRFKGIVNTVDEWFNLSSFKNVTAKIPGGSNNTSISKTLWDDAYKITPTNGSNAKSVIDDIIANGDNLGAKTEGLVDDIMAGQGYQTADGKYFGPNGTNGFDGVYFKGTLDNPTELIIIESKQMSSTGSSALSSPNASTGLPSQMSDGWIDYIANNKLMSLGGDKTTLATTINNANQGVITKYVIAVNKSTGEINFLKLGDF